MDCVTSEDLRLHALSLTGHADGVKLVRIGANLTLANLTLANLTDADMTGADLTRAYLTRAYLTRAYLTGANLTGADMTGADMTGAYLTGADLTGADMTGADMTGAYLTGADLTRADLAGAVGLPIADDAPARLLAVARAALQPGALEMGKWHTCKTTHSISGWAVHQAGELGKILESAAGNHMAGLYLLGHEAASHFYDSNEKATEYLRGVIAAADQQGEVSHG